MSVLPRSAWGPSCGQGPAAAPPSEVIIHHSYRPDTPAGASQSLEANVLRSIEDYHARTFWKPASRHKARIGYNFLVFQSGRAWEGVGWRHEGAHTADHNSKVGICLVIDGDAKQATTAAWEAVRRVIWTGVEQGHLARRFTVSGHRDYANKSCPGRLIYPRIQDLTRHPQEDDMTEEDRKMLHQTRDAIERLERLLKLVHPEEYKKAYSDSQHAH